MVQLEIAFLCSLFFLQGSHGSEEEYRLITDLTEVYDTSVVPVNKSGEIIKVKFGLLLQQILDLDEVHQLLSIYVWWRCEWTDSHLTWSPADHGNITDFRIDTRRIWKPDIVLYSEVTNIVKYLDKYETQVQHNGSVHWFTPVVLKSTCSLDVTYFPFDVQICPMLFGSWGYDGSAMEVTNRSKEGDLNYFMPHGEWDVIGLPVRSHIVYYSCCEHPYYDVTFFLIMQRKSLFYIYNLVLPCIFVTLTAVLGFLLPPESGEKISLGVTVLLAIAVFLLLVAESMPTQSLVVPLIAQYFGATIILLALSTGSQVFVLSLHHRGEFGLDVPDWMKVLFLRHLSKLVGLRHLAVLHATDMPSQRNMGVADGLGTSAQNISEILYVPSTSAKNDNIIWRCLSSICEDLQILVSHLDDRNTQNNYKTNWRFVAAVLDRCLFLMFLALFVTMTLTITLARPKLGDNVDDIVKHFEEFGSL